MKRTYWLLIFSFLFFINKPVKVIGAINENYTKSYFVQWSRQYVPKTQYGTHVKAMANDNQGNIYVTGGKNLYSNNDYDILNHYTFIAKYDINGVLKWSRKIKVKYFTDTLPGSICLDKDGYIYVGGSSFSAEKKVQTDAYGNTKNLFRKIYWLIKFDKDGKQIWGKNFYSEYGHNCEIMINTMKIDNNGNFYVAGHISGIFPGYIFQSAHEVPTRDAFVAKHNINDGNIYWLQQFGAYRESIPGKFDHGFEVVYALDIDNNGDVLLTGTTTGMLGSLPLSHFDYPTNTDYWIAKYDKTGNKKWLFQFGTEQNEVATGLSIVNNKIYISGYNTENTGDAMFNLGTNYQFGWVRCFSYDSNYVLSTLMFQAGTTKPTLSWTKNINDYENSTKIRIKIMGMTLKNNQLHLIGNIIDKTSDATAEYNQSIYYHIMDLNQNDIFRKYLGTGTFDSAAAITVDENNNAYLGGEFQINIDRPVPLCNMAATVIKFGKGIDISKYLRPNSKRKTYYLGILQTGVRLQAKGFFDINDKEMFFTVKIKKGDSFNVKIYINDLTSDLDLELYSTPELLALPAITGEPQPIEQFTVGHPGSLVWSAPMLGIFCDNYNGILAYPSGILEYYTYLLRIIPSVKAKKVYTPFTIHADVDSQ